MKIGGAVPCARQLETDADLAGYLSFLESVDSWITMRQLRIQMVHEYVEDFTVLNLQCTCEVSIDMETSA